MAKQITVVLQRDYKGHKAGATIQVDAAEWARESRWATGVSRGRR